MFEFTISRNGEVIARVSSLDREKAYRHAKHLVYISPNAVDLSIDEVTA